MHNLRQAYKIIKENYMTRNRNKEKKTFREYITGEFKKQGVILEEESGKSFAFIPIKKIKYTNLQSDNESCDCIITAHYDTPKQCEAMNLFNWINKINPVNLVTKEDTFLQLSDVLIVSIPWFLQYLIHMYYYKIFILILYSYLALTFLGNFFRRNKNNMNDNTSGILAALTLAEKLNKTGDIELKNKVKFILFDNEERGLVGSIGHYKKYKPYYKNKLIINLDCVGLGDNLTISYLNKIDMMDSIINTFAGCLEVDFLQKGTKVLKAFKMDASDYLSFKECRAISISLKEKGLLGYSVPFYHVARDKYLDLDNIELLTETIVNSVKAGLK